MKILKAIKRFFTEPIEIRIIPLFIGSFIGLVIFEIVIKPFLQ